MPRPSSSTSSSEPSSGAARSGLRVRGRARKAIATVGWTLAFCCALDVAVGVAFRPPRSNSARPSTLQQYFDYGRSLRGKLQRIVGPDSASADPIARAGWIGDLCTPKQPVPAGKLGVAFYGMSFSNHIAEAIEKMDPTIRTIEYAGPAAPPNHSYACFLRQRGGRDPNPVQVLGILASSVKGMLTLTGMTTTFEKPSPFTFPRYLPDGNGGLHEVVPLISTESELRDAVLHSPAKWDAFVAQLAANDRFYNATYMAGPTWSDQSTFVRLVRRSLAQHRARERGNAFYKKAGFSYDAELGPVLQTMVREFATKCRAEGQAPLVLLIQDQGSPDALAKLLAPTLDAAGVPYVSTIDIAPATDPSNFIPDGHFTDDANRRISERVLAKIREIAPRP